MSNSQETNLVRKIMLKLGADKINLLYLHIVICGGFNVAKEFKLNPVRSKSHHL